MGFDDAFNRRILGYHDDIVKVMKFAVSIMPFRILRGCNDPKHKTTPATAIDVAPLGKRRIVDIYRLAGVILAVSRILDVNLQWGGDRRTARSLRHYEI